MKTNGSNAARGLIMIPVLLILGYAIVHQPVSKSSAGKSPTQEETHEPDWRKEGGGPDGTIPGPLADDTTRGRLPRRGASPPGLLLSSRRTLLLGTKVKNVNTKNQTTKIQVSANVQAIKRGTRKVQRSGEDGSGDTTNLEDQKLAVVEGFPSASPVGGAANQGAGESENDASPTSSIVSSLTLPLLNDRRYVESYRLDACSKRKNAGAEFQQEVAPPPEVAADVESGESSSEDPLPKCPATFEHQKGDGDDTEKNINQRSEWVAKQYHDYAKKCGKKKGVMWKRMPHEVHDRFTGRMMDLVFHGKAVSDGDLPLTPTIDSSKKKKHHKQQLRWFDWASGCGADLFYYHKNYQQYVGTKAEFHAVGIDLVGAAVNWARGHMDKEFPGATGDDHSKIPSSGSNSEKKDTVRFCHADGTKLEWLPKDSFDVVTSLGGLIHLPKKFLCSTMQQLISLLKPKTGRLLTCYVHPKVMALDLFKCQYQCGGGGAAGVSQKVVATLLKQNEYLEGIGMPQAYTKVNASCILWERL